MIVLIWICCDWFLDLGWFVYWVYGFDLLENSVLIVLKFREEHEEFNGLDLYSSDLDLSSWVVEFMFL